MYSFSGYSIGKSGMNVNKMGLFVTSQNISNTNTKGYVRQQAIIKESRPQSLCLNQQIGKGSQVYEVRQIRATYLDNIYRQEKDNYGYHEGRSFTFENIESVIGAFTSMGLNESNGLKESMEEYFNAWQELSKDPESLTARTLVRQKSISFVETTNYLGKVLDQIQDELNSKIKGSIDKVNNIAKKISELNVSIMKAEISGDNANDYRDRRNNLLDELSYYVNTQVDEKPNKTVTVSVGGYILVDGDTHSEINAKKNGGLSEFYTPTWDYGDEVKLESGYIKGLIEGRGDVKGYTGSLENGSPVESGESVEDIENDLSDPSYNFDPMTSNVISELRRGLNNMVNILIRKTNSIHREGVTLDGDTGVDFFVKNNSKLPFEMGNIEVNPELYDINKIATSKSGELGDNTISNEIYNIKNKKLLKVGNISTNIQDYFNSIVGWVGTKGKEAYNSTKNSKTLVNQIDNQRQSISAVSLDEEMRNIIKFQQAYNASSKVLSMVDSMVDVLINRMAV